MVKAHDEHVPNLMLAISMISPVCSSKLTLNRRSPLGLGGGRRQAPMVPILFHCSIFGHESSTYTSINGILGPKTRRMLHLDLPKGSTNLPSTVELLTMVIPHMRQKRSSVRSNGLVHYILQHTVDISLVCLRQCETARCGREQR